MSSKTEFHSKLTGVTKKNENGESIQKLLEDLEGTSYEGAYLLLEHEPDNEYDPNAIKVYCDGDHIGYIKRELAAEIVDIVDEGRVEAEISEITGGEGKSLGCNIIIHIVDTPGQALPHKATLRADLPPDLIENAREYIRTVPTIKVFDLQRHFEIGYSTASALIDRLEEIGDIGPFQGANPRPVYTYIPQKPLGQKIFKPIIIACLIICVICYGTIFAINRHREKKADWDRLAISTATVALDQYAPWVDYGPLRTTGWTVIHNNDGTTTVWAPKAYGNIALMMTDDGEKYTPYWISVDGTVVIDYDP